MEECTCGCDEKCLCDGESRLEQLSKLGDPLERLNELIDLDKFREPLSVAYPSGEVTGDNNETYDTATMFKVLVLQHLYNLSDEQMEYQITDRATFRRFLGLSGNDDIPNARSIFEFRNSLIRTNLINRLFDTFETLLEDEEEDRNNSADGKCENADSILLSIKKLMGITAEYEHFDADLIIHINSALSVLTQLGVGSSESFSIKDYSATWADFMGMDSRIDFVKSYVHLKVKLLFDPPINSAVIESINRMISELEWRIMVTADSNESEVV